MTSDVGAFSSAFFSPRQQQYLIEFLIRFQSRRKMSLQNADALHRHLVNMPMPFPFCYPVKDFYFPLTITAASGTMLQDADQNRYLDFSMGYGSRLFGYDPPGEAGNQAGFGSHIDFALGFPPERMLRIVEMLQKLTGLDRFYFCTTGSEAVMLALRMARAYTGKQQVAIFTESNHGQYDSVVATQQDSLDRMTVWGIPSAYQQDLLLLDYCQDASLEIIDANRESLAAVLVEPCQTRHPERDPSIFLRKLHALAGEAPFLLIFDELVSGFRLHPAGARGFWGIDASLVLYGKSLGNGMPLAVIGGQRRVMDLLDGGDWNFGDCSRPVLLTVPHGSTYSMHPLAMQAAEATLERLVAEGPGLQEKLNRQTADLISGINVLLEEKQTPFRMAGWGSFFGPVWHNAESRHWELSLVYLHLLEEGALLWGLSGFLSTAHTKEDMALVQEAFRSSISKLQSADFLKSS